MSNTESAREQLTEQLGRLLTRVGKVESDLRRARDRDSQEQAIELENDEVLEELDEMTLGEIRRVRTALDRIANGTYGTCLTCGRAISADRLAAIPSAPTCVNCSAGQRG
jgi:RNA polymerase-binding transcription factor DksA